MKVVIIRTVVLCQKLCQKKKIVIQMVAMLTDLHICYIKKNPYTTHTKPSTPKSYLGRGKHSFSIYLVGIVLTQCLGSYSEVGGVGGGGGVWF